MTGHHLYKEKNHHTPSVTSHALHKLLAAVAAGSVVVEVEPGTEAPGRESKRNQQEFPIGSMYGIFTYIWLIFMVNVGIYTIHGWYGFDPSQYTLEDERLEPTNHQFRKENDLNLTSRELCSNS